MKAAVPGHYARHVSSWRRLAGATWHAANDPTIYGTLSVDATRAMEYVRRLSQRSHHVTITHLVTKAIANTLAAHPDCNAYVRRGRIFIRDEVDVFVLVTVPPRGGAGGDEQAVDLTGVKVCRANDKSVVEIADEVAARARRVRRGADPEFARAKRLLDSVPQSLLRSALGLLTYAQYELNLDLSPLGVPRDSFGGVFVTSLGMLGIQYAFPPIVPVTRLAANVAVGRVEDAAVVEDGRVVVRPRLPLTATFDHRVIDGYQASRLGETFTSILQNPERFLG